MVAAALPDEAPLPADHLVGRWRIVRLLGSGGTASVYEAQHTELPRRAALKVLHHRYAYSHEMRSRFLREGRAAASVTHPHVVTVHDVDVADERLFLVMDLLDGEALRDRLRRDGPLSPAALVRLFAPIADALAAVHRAGILHRDISPGNIFLVGPPALTSPPLSPAVPAVERAVLLDFSSAHIDEPSSDVPLTRTQALLGTPAYMSPEQCRGARNLDARADVFSLGAVLYLSVTGHPPFAGDTWQSLLVDVLSGKRTPARVWAPTLPPALDALIERAMAHDPAQRFPTAAALRDALLAVDLRPRSPRGPLVAGAVATIVALTALAAAVLPWPVAAPPARAPAVTSIPVSPSHPAASPALPTPTPTPIPTPALPPASAPGPLSPPPPRHAGHPPRLRGLVAPVAVPAALPATTPASFPVAPAPPLPRGTNNALILPHGAP